MGIKCLLKLFIFLLMFINSHKTCLINYMFIETIYIFINVYL
jgi:hypothetical protein